MKTIIMEGKRTKLCRICLEDGAQLPLFDSCDQNTENKILTKLSLCLNEKVEDIENYPQYICNNCYKDLEVVCNFINKYRNSCDILQKGLHVLKLEKENSDFSCNEQSEVEIDIKTELNNECDSDSIDDQPLKSKKLQLEKKNRKINKCAIKTKVTTKTKQKSINKVAASILEGKFVWTGNYWCLKSFKDDPKIKKDIKKTVRQRKLKVILPKPDKSLQSKLCDLCGEVFNTQDKLSKHKKKVHYKNPVKCPNCPKLLSSQYYLVRHVKRKHGGQRDYVCSECGKAFAFKNELTGHIMKVHQKSIHVQKKYACKFCDKTYKCQKSVIVHERSAHTGDRPAVCSECGTSFYHEEYLREHMRLHTGETPFKCPICGRGYAQRGNMKSHLRIHRLSDLDAVTLSKMKPNYLKLLKA